MKKLLSLILILTFVFACSSDSEDSMAMNDDEVAMEDDGAGTDDDSDDTDDSSDDMNDEETPSPIIGVWVLTELHIEEGQSTDDLELAQAVLQLLVENECDVATFDFMEDGTLVSENKASFLEVSVGLDGITVPCPEESSTESVTWVLDGDQLTLTDNDRDQETITIELEGDTLIIASGGIDPDFDGADAVFTRSVEE